MLPCCLPCFWWCRLCAAAASESVSLWDSATCRRLTLDDASWISSSNSSVTTAYASMIVVDGSSRCRCIRLASVAGLPAALVDSTVSSSRETAVDSTESRENGSNSSLMQRGDYTWWCRTSSSSSNCKKKQVPKQVQCAVRITWNLLFAWTAF